MKRLLKRVVPVALRPTARKIFYFPFDTAELLLGRRDRMTPPTSRIFVGSGDFKQIGEEFLRYFVEFGGLRPSDRVLDVGCGIGRMAIPLTKYLAKEGSYEGFDIVADGIHWCGTKIMPRYPNFHFRLADVRSLQFNPKGRYEACQYKFPYNDESFDFVFLTSVFTHMLPQDMENYLSEVARVLKKDRRCLVTFFLLNAESLELIEANLSTQDFRYDLGVCRTTNEKNAEAAIAYRESFIRSAYEKRSLTVAEPIHYGSWCGREDFLSYQDIILATKA